MKKYSGDDFREEGKEMEWDYISNTEKWYKFVQ